MSFTEAIWAGLDGYKAFSGRASRSAYWWWVAFFWLVALIASILDRVFGSPTLGYLKLNDGYLNLNGSYLKLYGEVVASVGIVATMAGLLLFLPSLSVAVRRLHDTSRSGWWVLIAIIPLFGAIMLAILMLTGSTPIANKYGPVPPEVAGDSPAPPPEPSPL